MTTLLRIPARIQAKAATLNVTTNHVVCWIAGAFLSLEMLGRGVGAI